MAELENKEEVETPEIEVETPEEDIPDDSEDISYEQAIERKKKAERTEKAEKKLVELKKANKAIKAIKKENSSNISPKEEVKQILAEERFYEKNPEAEAYREKIEEYRNKGLSLDDAYLISSKKDREIEKNREIYGESFVKGGTNNESLSVVSIDTFDKMTIKAQSEYTEKMTSKYGKVKFK